MPPPPQKKSIARKIFSSKKQLSQYNDNHYTTKTKKSIGFPLSSAQILPDFCPKTYGDFFKRRRVLGKKAPCFYSIYTVFFRAKDWSHAAGGHWTERAIGSEGSGWSDSGSRNEHKCAKFQAMAQSPTRQFLLSKNWVRWL